MSLDALQKPRPYLEEFFASLVNEDVATFTRLNSVKFEKDTPRFEITVRIGANRPNSRHVDTSNGIIIYDTWDFTVKIDVITRPNANPLQNSLHPDMVASIASAMIPAHRNSWTNTDLMPYHAIAEALRQTGQQSILASQEGTERTSMTWNGIVAIRQTAWSN